MATVLEETQRVFSVVDAYSVDLEITPRTGDEDLREIGAIGSLLLELIKETCGLTGRITVEESSNGVRVRVKPNKQDHACVAACGGA